MNEKFVINIGRQLGSGGKAVGERLAERFGIPVYDKRLIKMAAEHSGFGQEFFERPTKSPPRGSSPPCSAICAVRSRATTRSTTTR